MKTLLIKLILVYQKFSKNAQNKCRLKPTCSNYAKEAISRFGAFFGTLLTIKRLIKCGSKLGVEVDKVPHNIKGDFKWLI